MSLGQRYGLAVFGAIWFVGWITGMGGSPLPNFIFSALVGLLAWGLFALAQRTTKNDRD